MADNNLKSNRLNLFIQKKFYIKDDFKPKDIVEVINSFKLTKSAYDTLYNYYIGKHDILHRTFEDTNKPNNRTVHNFPKLIVSTATAYFAGIPISYHSEKTQLLDKILQVHKYNYTYDVDYNLATLASIYGHAFEMHWISKGRHKYKAVAPSQVIMCYSMDLEETPKVAITYIVTEDEVTKKTVYNITAYTDKHILKFKANEQGEVLGEPSTSPHYFNRVPVIEYLNNEERQGDFESVISLIDSYNLAVAESLNEIEYWNDSYLLLRNLTATDSEDIAEMKENRVLLVDGDGDANWLTKNVNDKHFENIKDRLTMDIHKMSQVPNLSDEAFANNLSGIAIKNKMFNLETKTMEKERKFTSSLQERNELIAYKLNLVSSIDDIVDVNAVFTRNLPANLIELADVASKVRGLFSDETLRTQFPFCIENEEETRRLEKEAEKNNLLKYDMNSIFEVKEIEEETNNGELDDKK